MTETRNAALTDRPCRASSRAGGAATISAGARIARSLRWLSVTVRRDPAAAHDGCRALISRRGGKTMRRRMGHGRGTAIENAASSEGQIGNRRRRQDGAERGGRATSVRTAVEVFIDELDLAALGFSGATPAATGRPAYHPSTLLNVYGHSARAGGLNAKRSPSSPCGGPGGWRPTSWPFHRHHPGAGARPVRRVVSSPQTLHSCRCCY